MAPAIHDRSRRKDRAFAEVNCAAIPTSPLGRDLISRYPALSDSKTDSFSLTGMAP